MGTFHNRVAIVTGGNSGIGYATAKELKAKGATVVITGRRKEAVEKAAAELGVTGVVADQGNLADTEQLVARVSKDFGKVDILFINAGVIELQTIADATEQHFDFMMNINLKGAYFTLGKFIPFLKDGASVVLLSSNMANSVHVSSSVYAASKAALNSVMKTAALELAPRKIRVNSVSPGPTETEIFGKGALPAEAIDAMKAALIEQLPLKRMGTADEVAKMVVFLSEESAGFITGSDFVMDGGMVIS